MGLFSMQHHPHQRQQGPSPAQHIQHTRPSPIIHQQQYPQAQHSQQHYPSAHSNTPVYQAHNQAAANAQHTPDGLPYYAQPSPYSTPGATGGYPSADNAEMMAAAQMPRPPYPPMSYHTPQSNSPASVASPSQHDQHRSLYGQPQSQHLQQSMYYQPQQPQYSSMPPQAAPSPYAQHAQHAQQSHQTMTSQPTMMMSHTAPQNPMAQHASQHAQAGMTASPRHMKAEPQVPLHVPQKPQPQQMAQQMSQQMPQQMGHSNHGAQNGASLNSAAGQQPGVNPNAAPGPIPATTPLVVRQDQNGVQWIAFEYSRDRVKMEYTIRCDVESVNTEELSADFKTENCVYPRACCPKDQYRGNRLQYETECNTVGWALAQLNPPLRGKRGLIQRAVDSWRNSNQDPRLRSRRVRRMAKMNNRKVQNAAHPGAAHMPGATGPTGMPGAPGGMGPGSAAMGKPQMNHMGQAMHPHQGAGHHDGAGAGDDVGDDDSYMDEQHHTPTGRSSGVGADVRQTQVFSGPYGAAYPTSVADQTGAAGGLPPHLAGGHHQLGHAGHHAGSAIAARHGSVDDDKEGIDRPAGLFPDMPDGKKRKFILVDDNVKGSRLRVRVTLDGVDTTEIPDSFRKGASVYPRSYFPREMQSPPPSPTGSRFFMEDLDTDTDGRSSLPPSAVAAEDDGTEETDGRAASRRIGGARGKANSKSAAVTVRVPIEDGEEAEVSIPRMRKGARGREVRLNDLGYRLAWLQSRVFAGRTVFLQRALDCYRNKTRSAIESINKDVKVLAPHYETRVGKRKFNERIGKEEKQETS